MRSNLPLVFTAKIVRTFTYGFLGVFFPIYLTRLGLGARGLGVAVTLTLLASAGLTYLIRRPAEKYGARTVLMILCGLIVLSAALFLLFQQPWLVVLAGMIGNLAVGAGETGPFLSLEQVVISREATHDKMAATMSAYNLAGYVSAAVGAVFAGKMAQHPALFFSLYLLGGLIQGLVYRRMGVEPVYPQRPAISAQTNALVQRLAALFALDAFAGGFIVQSIVVYWFQRRFGLDAASLGWIFFGAQMMTGLSLLLTPLLAKKLGLVNTMVFTHIISNLILMMLAFAPSATMAVALLLARQLLSQMDVPTRQAFLVLAVQDHEREGAVSLTNISRTVAQSVSPALTGWIMQAAALSAPFVVAGALKILYDLSLYRLTKGVPLR